MRPQYPQPRAGRFLPAGEQRQYVGDWNAPTPKAADEYPSGRERGRLVDGSYGLRSDRYESNNETTLADTDATIITFSGRPDAIILQARSFPALVTLTDRMNRETSTILVQVGAALDAGISRERVIARNAIPGSNAILNVVGKWLTTRAADPEYDPLQRPTRS